jgi:hypothetical protein
MILNFKQLNQSINIPIKNTCMKIFLSTLLLVSIVALSSCTKTVQAPSQSYAVTGTISASSWAKTSDGLGYFVSLNVPGVTQNVVNNGGVAVYLSFDNGATFEALPEVVQGIAYGTYYSVGTVNIDFYAANGTSGLTAPPGGTLIVKVLITQP